MRLILSRTLPHLLTMSVLEASSEDGPADATPAAVVPDSDPNINDSDDNPADPDDNTGDHCTTVTGTQLPRATAAD